MELRRQNAIAKLRPGKAAAEAEPDKEEPKDEPKPEAQPEVSGKDAGDQLLSHDEVGVLSDLAKKTGMYDRVKVGICKELGVKVDDMTIDDVQTLPRRKYDEFIDFLRKV